MAQRQSTYQTYGRSRAVRLPDHDYASDAPTHLTICAEHNLMRSEVLARLVCDNVEFYCTKLRYRLYAYCLMLDHLHVLLSPAESGIHIEKWLDSFKSYTTNRFMKAGGKPPLWQRSANDHVCRVDESVENAVRYLANNPVRAGLIEKWDNWPWTKVLVEV